MRTESLPHQDISADAKSSSWKMKMIFIHEDTGIIGSSGFAGGVMEYLRAGRPPANISKKYEPHRLDRILPTFNKGSVLDSSWKPP